MGLGECSTHHLSGRWSTYANHRDTEDTEDAQSSCFGEPKEDLRVAFVFSVSSWLAYVAYAIEMYRSVRSWSFGTFVGSFR